MHLSVVPTVLLLMTATTNAVEDAVAFGRSARRPSLVRARRTRRDGDAANWKVAGPRRWFQTPAPAVGAATPGAARPEKFGGLSDGLRTRAMPKASKTTKKSASSAPNTGTSYFSKKSADRGVIAATPWSHRTPTSKASKSSKTSTTTVTPKASKSKKPTNLSADWPPESLSYRGIEPCTSPWLKSSKSKSTLSADWPAESMSFGDLDPGTSHSSKTSKSAIFADWPSESMSYEGSDPSTSHWSKASKSQASADWPAESMSYAGFDPDASLPPATTGAPEATAASPEPMFDNVLGRIIFQYLSRCTGIALDMDTCLVSATIDAFMSTVYVDSPPQRRLHLDPSKKRLRVLQTVDEASHECGPQEDPTEQSIRSLVESAQQRCRAEQGVPVSDAEAEGLVAPFLRLASSGVCWASLCGADAFRLQFGQAAMCAGGAVRLPACALEHIFRLIPGVAAGAGEAPCVQPSAADWSFFVAFMLTDATAECGDGGVAIGAQERDAAAADLLAIFSASRCWEGGDCDGEPPAATAGVDAAPHGTVVEGTRCISAAAAPGSGVEPVPGRDVELSFFYRLETSGPLLEASVAGIEHALLEVACRGDVGVRRILVNDIPQDTLNIIAVNSAPKDLVSLEHTCSVTSQFPAVCSIVEGKITLTVEGGCRGQTNAGGDGQEACTGEETALLYAKVKAMFDRLSPVPANIQALADSNVVAVEYIGPEAPSAMAPAVENVEVAPANGPPDVRADGSPPDTPSIDKLARNDAEDGAEVNAALLVAASGGLLAMALLFAFLRRGKQGEHDSPPENKAAAADGDDQSTAFHTVAPTVVSSCDRSEVSSFSSPTRSIESPVGVDARQVKFFVVAEDQADNWRDLSILPQEDGTLEGVREEEGEFVNSVASVNDGEMSV